LAGLAAGLAVCCTLKPPSPAQAAHSRPPNVVMIMGDDIGWFNIGA
jgi:arylsulfatase